MYRDMRRIKNQQSEETAYRYLDDAQWGVLSLCAEGLPYGVPVSHAVDGKTLYFHGALQGQKLDFIRANPKGWFTAVPTMQVLRTEGSTKYECVMAFGTVRVVDDPEERLKGFDAINAKFTDGFELGRSFVEKWGARTLVFALDIERITAKCTRSESDNG